MDSHFNKNEFKDGYMAACIMLKDAMKDGELNPEPIPLPTIKPGDKVKYTRNLSYGVGEVKGIDAFVKFEHMLFTTRVSPDDLEIAEDGR